jgi:hypothetical protein
MDADNDRSTVRTSQAGQFLSVKHGCCVPDQATGKLGLTIIRSIGHGVGIVPSAVSQRRRSLVL